MPKISVRAKIVPALSVSGGMTATIFPAAEAVLRYNLQCRKDVLKLRREPPYHYLSLMDLVFCELHPVWRTPCFRYYHEGVTPHKQLRELITEEAKEHYTRRLIYALEVVCATGTEGPRGTRRSWSWLRREVDRVIPPFRVVR